MKKRGQNFEVISNYLVKHGPSTAADIQKATKVKGNIYTTLQTMVNRKIISRFGKLYQATLGEAVKVYEREDKANPMIKMLQKEIDYIQDGIDSLLITKNYLERRLEQLQS